METGFLQVTTNRTDYKLTAERNGQVGHIIHYAKTNQRILDVITADCDGGLNKAWPWYDATGQGGVGFFKGSDENAAVTKIFNVQDTPAVLLPTVDFMANNLLWTPARVDIHWDFELNIAARTFDSGVIFSEKENFTQLATGTWAWDGDAKVNARAWVADGPSVTRQQDLTAVTSGKLIDWELKNLPENQQYFNNYLYPWLVQVNNVWVPHSKHTLQ